MSARIFILLLLLADCGYGQSRPMVYVHVEQAKWRSDAPWDEHQFCPGDSIFVDINLVVTRQFENLQNPFPNASPWPKGLRVSVADLNTLQETPLDSQFFCRLELQTVERFYFQKNGLTDSCEYRSRYWGRISNSTKPSDYAIIARFQRPGDAQTTFRSTSGPFKIISKEEDRLTSRLWIAEQNHDTTTLRALADSLIITGTITDNLLEMVISSSPAGEDLARQLRYWDIRIKQKPGKASEYWNWLDGVKKQGVKEALSLLPDTLQRVELVDSLLKAWAVRAPVPLIDSITGNCPWLLSGDEEVRRDARQQHSMGHFMQLATQKRGFRWRFLSFNDSYKSGQISIQPIPLFQNSPNPEEIEGAPNWPLIELSGQQMSDSLLRRFDHIIDSIGSAPGLIIDLRRFSDSHLDWICKALGRFVDRPTGLVRIVKRNPGTNDQTETDFTIMPRGKAWTRPLAIEMYNDWPHYGIRELLKERPLTFCTGGNSTPIPGIEPDTIDFGFHVRALIPTAIAMDRDYRWVVPWTSGWAGITDECFSNPRFVACVKYLRESLLDRYYGFARSRKFNLDKLLFRIPRHLAS